MYPSRIPEVYKLITNDGEYMINGHPTTLQMAEYMTKKVKAGMKVENILFRVIPVKLQSARDILGESTLY